MTVDAKIYSRLIAELKGERCEPRELQIVRKRISGGLEAQCVERISIRYRDRNDRCKSLRLVLKQLPTQAAREASIYRHVLCAGVGRLSPEVYLIDDKQDGALLLLEDVPRVSSWPWREFEASSAVLRRLAAFHEQRTCGLPEWDYESELQRSAIATLDLLQAMRRAPEWSSFARRGIRPLRRMATHLSQRRSALLSFAPHDAAVIHGDVHPGNVIMRRRGGCDEPVLIDWGRTRVGSALEDVSSWLQSLGYWEPEARRRHDTLLRDYLSARGSDTELSSDLRAAYWMAGASNALAGALRYYCSLAMSSTDVEDRAKAIHAAANWMRVIVRADALSS